MNALGIAIAALALTACSSGDFENLTSYLPLEKPQAEARARFADAETQAAPAEATPPQQAAPSMDATASSPDDNSGPDPAIVKRCKALAQQRASDGALFGYDADMQQQEYDGTFARCMTFKTAHSL